MPSNVESPPRRVGQVVTIETGALEGLPMDLGVIVQSPSSPAAHRYDEDWYVIAALRRDSRFGMQVRIYVLYGNQFSITSFRPTIYEEGSTYERLREYADRSDTGSLLQSVPDSDGFIRAIHRFLFAAHARRCLTPAERQRENTICGRMRVGDRYRVPLGSLSGVFRVTEVGGGTAVGITPNSSDEPSCAEFAIDNEGTFYVPAASLSELGSRITGWEAESPPDGLMSISDNQGEV